LRSASRSIRCRARARSCCWSASSTKPEREPRTARPVEPPDDLSRIAELEGELDATRKELQRAIHDLETANEEQKAISQEAMSANEEFQSTNEELMTSREELQSLNEELTALNNQLQETLETQRSTSNDLQNILDSSGVATLFLDSDLNTRFSTPVAKSLFRIIATDIGRPLADLARRINDARLLADAGTVLAGHVPPNREVEAETERGTSVAFGRTAPRTPGLPGWLSPCRHIREETARTGNRGSPVLFRQHHQHHSPTTRQHGDDHRQSAEHDHRQPVAPTLQHLYSGTIPDCRDWLDANGRPYRSRLSFRILDAPEAHG